MKLVAEAPVSAPGPYTLLTKIAVGGMATVYVGSKQGAAGFERLVAIKSCHPHLREDEEFVSMFLDEARLAARIHHPNVVATLDVACADVLYLVMDYIEGDTLSTLLRRSVERGIQMPIQVAVRIAIDTLAGLHAAHELCDGDGQPLNLVHRDVSPQNVLVGVDGVSRISDFGVAFAAARSTATNDGRLKGKFAYMAPEQVAGEPATRRVDVFAAGIVLWEALTCRRLFRRKDDIASINAVLKADVPPPSSLAPVVPPALDAIVLKALACNADERYQTAAEFGDALERLHIDGVTSRSVAAHVDKVLGSMLAERRAVIREASQLSGDTFGPDSTASHVQRRLLGAPMSGAPPSSISGVGNLGTPSQPGAHAQEVRQPPDPATLDDEVLSAQDIEHRRMRSLLAAAMLLLVGSGVGLLLASRSGPTPPAASPPQPPVPAQTKAAAPRR